MKIVHVNTYDTVGGAARAAFRLHRGLLQCGNDSSFLVRHKLSSDKTVYGIEQVSSSRSSSDELIFSSAIQGQYINAHRSELTNTYYSLAYPGYDLSKLSIMRNADVINLHWVANYQSPVSLYKLFQLNIPIVWTLHDQAPFTGGCHYAAGCKRYVSDCNNCPQLTDDPYNLALAILRDKLCLYKNANLTIVSPSKWLAECASESSLFHGRRVEVIPYSLDTDVFQPIPKEQAKKQLGIAPHITTLLFGAHTTNEKRKGFKELLSAVSLCMASTEFSKMVQCGRLKLIILGDSSKEIQATGIPVHSIGFLTADEQIAIAYSAADIFILPSLEDNLPNTILESMSCGTPVVAFEVGGVPDVLDESRGIISPLGDVQHMSNAILSLIHNPTHRVNLGINCREMIKQKFALSIQATNYISLYEGLQHSKRYQRSPLGLTKIFTSSAHTNPDKPNKNLYTNVITALGPNFEEIYEDVLSKALREMPDQLSFPARLLLVKRVYKVFKRFKQRVKYILGIE